MTTQRRPAFLLALALITGGAASTGCASGGYPGLDQASGDTQSAFLKVHNNNWLDMRVYVLAESGHAQRVGTVTAMSQAVFRLRMPSATGLTRILLRPIGSRATYTTNTVIMNPGSQAELTVQNQLSLSNLIIR